MHSRSRAAFFKQNDWVVLMTKTDVSLIAFAVFVLWSVASVHRASRNIDNYFSRTLKDRPPKKPPQ
jgi:hypothetical protein